MMHHRLTQRKNPSQEDIDKALSILIEAAKALLSKQQPQAGCALALLVVKHYTDYKLQVADYNVSQLLNIAACFISDSEATEEVYREKLRFLKAAISWSRRPDCAGYKNGHARLNTLTAQAAVDVRDFELAQQLFVRSDDPHACAAFLYSFSNQETLASEHALVLTRTIVRYLLADNIKDAVLVRERFAELAGWSSMGNETARSAVEVPPLAHFCELLVKLCRLETAAAPLFQRVCNSYAPELKRDESLWPLLTKIGSKYFNIQPAQPAGMAGMMNSMLRGMMNN